MFSSVKKTKNLSELRKQIPVEPGAEYIALLTIIQSLETGRERKKPTIISPRISYTFQDEELQWLLFSVSWSIENDRVIGRPHDKTDNKLIKKVKEFFLFYSEVDFKYAKKEISLSYEASKKIVDRIYFAGRVNRKIFNYIAERIAPIILNQYLGPESVVAGMINAVYWIKDETQCCVSIETNDRTTSTEFDYFFEMAYWIKLTCPFLRPFLSRERSSIDKKNNRIGTWRIDIDNDYVEKEVLQQIKEYSGDSFFSFEKEESLAAMILQIEKELNNEKYLPCLVEIEKLLLQHENKGFTAALSVAESDYFCKLYRLKVLALEDWIKSLSTEIENGSAQAFLEFLYKKMITSLIIEYTLTWHRGNSPKNGVETHETLALSTECLLKRYDTDLKKKNIHPESIKELKKIKEKIFYYVELWKAKNKMKNESTEIVFEIFHSLFKELPSNEIRQQYAICTGKEESSLFNKMLLFSGLPQGFDIETWSENLKEYKNEIFLNLNHRDELFDIYSPLAALYLNAYDFSLMIIQEEEKLDPLILKNAEDTKTPILIKRVKKGTENWSMYGCLNDEKDWQERTLDLSNNEREQIAYIIPFSENRIIKKSKFNIALLDLFKKGHGHLCTEDEFALYIENVEQAISQKQYVKQAALYLNFFQFILKFDLIDSDKKSTQALRIVNKLLKREEENIFNETTYFKDTDQNILDISILLLKFLFVENKLNDKNELEGVYNYIVQKIFMHSNKPQDLLKLIELLNNDLGSLRSYPVLCEKIIKKIPDLEKHKDLYILLGKELTALPEEVGSSSQQDDKSSVSQEEQSIMREENRLQIINRQNKGLFMNIREIRSKIPSLPKAENIVPVLFLAGLISDKKTFSGNSYAPCEKIMKDLFSLKWEKTGDVFVASIKAMESKSDEMRCFFSPYPELKATVLKKEIRLNYAAVEKLVYEINIKNKIFFYIADRLSNIIMNSEEGLGSPLVDILKSFNWKKVSDTQYYSEISWIKSHQLVHYNHFKDFYNFIYFLQVFCPKLKSSLIIRNCEISQENKSKSEAVFDIFIYIDPVVNNDEEILLLFSEKKLDSVRLAYLEDLMKKEETMECLKGIEEDLINHARQGWNCKLDDPEQAQYFLKLYQLKTQALDKLIATYSLLYFTHSLKEDTWDKSLLIDKFLMHLERQKILCVTKEYLLNWHLKEKKIDEKYTNETRKVIYDSLDRVYKKIIYAEGGWLSKLERNNDTDMKNMIDQSIKNTLLNEMYLLTVRGFYSQKIQQYYIEGMNIFLNLRLQFINVFPRKDNIQAIRKYLSDYENDQINYLPMSIVEELYLWLAEAYKKEGNIKLYVLNAKKVISYQPYHKQFNSYHKLITSLWDSVNQEDEALRLINDVLRRESSCLFGASEQVYSLYVHRALLYFQMKRHDEACKDFEIALSGYQSFNFITDYPHLEEKTKELITHVFSSLSEDNQKKVDFLLNKNEDKKENEKQNLQQVIIKKKRKKNNKNKKKNKNTQNQVDIKVETEAPVQNSQHLVQKPQPEKIKTRSNDDSNLNKVVYEKIRSLYERAQYYDVLMLTSHILNTRKKENLPVDLCALLFYTRLRIEFGLGYNTDVDTFDIWGVDTFDILARLQYLDKNLIKEHPDRRFLNESFAAYYSMIKNYRLALQYLHEGKDKHALGWQELLIYALFLSSEKRFNEAQDFLQQSIECAPDKIMNATAEFNLAILSILSKDERSDDDLNKAYENLKQLQVKMSNKNIVFNFKKTLSYQDKDKHFEFSEKHLNALMTQSQINTCSFFINLYAFYFLSLKKEIMPNDHELMCSYADKILAIIPNFEFVKLQQVESINALNKLQEKKKDESKSVKNVPLTYSEVLQRDEKENTKIKSTYLRILPQLKGSGGNIKINQEEVQQDLLPNFLSELNESIKLSDIDKSLEIFKKAKNHYKEKQQLMPMTLINKITDEIYRWCNEDANDKYAYNKYWFNHAQILIDFHDQIINAVINTDYQINLDQLSTQTAYYYIHSKEFQSVPSGMYSLKVSENVQKGVAAALNHMKKEYHYYYDPEYKKHSFDITVTKPQFLNDYKRNNNFRKNNNRQNKKNNSRQTDEKNKKVYVVRKKA